MASLQFHWHYATPDQGLCSFGSLCLRYSWPCFVSSTPLPLPSWFSSIVVFSEGPSLARLHKGTLHLYPPPPSHPSSLLYFLISLMINWCMCMYVHLFAYYVISLLEIKFHETEDLVLFCAILSDTEKTIIDWINEWYLEWEKEI